MERHKKLWGIFLSTASDLALMDCPVFSTWWWLGLSSFGEKIGSWLDSSPLKKKGNKVMEGSSLVLVVGDLEGEGQYFLKMNVSHLID